MAETKDDIDIKENEGGKSKKKNGMDFNFDDSRRAPKVENFMGKKYKIKNRDVVKNSGVSIWKVISNRYNQSGLRRLFGTEAEQ